MGRRIDMIGKKFGRLTVTKLSKNRSSDGRLMYYCDCDCGTIDVEVRGKSLRNGTTQSCGCLHREAMFKRNKKYNKYDLSGEYGIGWTSNTNKEFYFDLEDYDKIKDYCWWETDAGYIYCVMYDFDKRIGLHNLVTGFPYVDHIKHNKKDNRKSQLREANDRYNSKNQSKHSNNTSGHTGVSLDKEKNKWEAYIGVDYKRIHLGYYHNIEDAIKARKEAEEKYYGEWSYDNSMKLETG